MERENSYSDGPKLVDSLTREIAEFTEQLRSQPVEKKSDLAQGFAALRTEVWTREATERPLQSSKQTAALEYLFYEPVRTRTQARQERRRQIIATVGKSILPIAGVLLLAQFLSANFWNSPQEPSSESVEVIRTQ